MSGVRGGISERNVTGVWLKVLRKRVGSASVKSFEL